METSKFIKNEAGEWVDNDPDEKKLESAKIIEDNKQEIAKIKEEESQTVTVNKKALEEVMGRLKRLESAADVGRLGHYDEKNKETIKHIVLLSTWDGKVIVGWKMIKDDVQKVNGIWREYQIIQVKLEDDTIIDLPYLQFSQEVVKVDAEILSRTKESDGHETLKVLRKSDGKEYLLDVTFVN